MSREEQLDLKSKIDFVVKSLNEYIELASKEGVNVNISITDNESCTAIEVKAKCSIEI